MALFSRTKARPAPAQSSSSKHVRPPNAVAFDGRTAGSESATDPALEERILALGSRLIEEARGSRGSFLSAAFWSDKLMDWAMKDEAFKVQLFRFVDAFPVIRHSSQSVHEHLVDYLTQPGVTPPPFLAAGLKVGGLAKGLMARTVSGQIEGMAKRFIAGTDAKDALPQLKKLWGDGIAFSVDLLGEACVSDEEALAYQRKYLDLIENLPESVNAWPRNERLESDHLGPIPRTNVSIKISSLHARTDAIDFEGSIRALLDVLVPILGMARERGVFINFDMEQRALKDLTLELFMRCCEAVDFQAGLAMQAYLRSGDDDAKRIIDWSKRTGRQVSVRLVKGAYWDYETIHAEQQGWPVPVWSRKQDTDACFERLSRMLVEATPRAQGQGGVKLALGSHNVRSIAHALALVERSGLPENAIELQMLHGMADELKDAAAERGLRVREYVPVGEMIPGMAYLVRRLLENTSNESWLKAGFLDKASPDELLRSPHLFPSEPSPLGRGLIDPGLDRIENAPERHALSPAIAGVGDGRPFFTEPMRDFAIDENRRAFAEAVNRAQVPQVANDSTVEQAKEAVRIAAEAFSAWQDADPRLRANVLVRAAAIMRERRDELSGIIIKENGKDWRNADADVTEAIDFCEYYAREAVPLFEYQRLGRFAGELDQIIYQPRGVAVIISPWNFPLAICCGMTAAALVTGNTVIVKPAEQTPAIAKIMCEIFWEALRELGTAGFQPGKSAGTPGFQAGSILHFLPGRGETVGAALVRDPRIALIAFTGSRAVGLDIIKAAGITLEEQPFIKKVICEMGGKNAIIVDASADLDEAVLGVRQSAFGFQGQKCSACSRAIVVESAYDTFLHRLVESTKSLVIGDPRNPGTDIGPVIDEEAAKNIRAYIEIGKQEGKLELAMEYVGPEEKGAQAQEKGLRPLPCNPSPASVTGAESDFGAGRGAERGGGPSLQGARDGATLSSTSPPCHFIGPHIFSGIQPHHRLAREEIFGPVLSVMKVKDFDEALEVANSTAYKLTGGVFSRKPSHLERARREFRVGNLYLNRGITGALVGRQPFGGFGMSGVGSKAGGRDYLLQFVEPRAITENTMRRGFAPEL